MQTVYIGNTLVNDVMIGSNRMSDVISPSPSLVTSGLTAWFDAAYSASATSWRARVNPPNTQVTASLSRAAYSSTPPEYLNLTGSISTLTFIQNAEILSSASLNGTGSRTIMAFIYPKESSSLDNNLIFTGGTANSRLLLQITSGSLNNLKLESADASNTVTQSIATQLGEIHYNQWNLVGYTTDGTNTFNGIDIWLNQAKQSLSGSTQWIVNGIYLESSTFTGLKPYYGYIADLIVYNRKLTDYEWLQNYQYFQYRFGNI